MTPDLLKLAADMRKRAAAQREISGRASGSEVRYSMALDYEADSLERFATELERIAQADHLEPLRNQVRVQGYDGNWNYDEYMRGMFNGLECALATLEGRDPVFKEAPDKYLCDMPREPLVVVADGTPTDCGTPVTPAADQDGWIPWAGGECPGDGIVCVRFRDGHDCTAPLEAARWGWAHYGNEYDIIAYRVVKEGEK